MQFVVDANILFAAMIRNSVTREILLSPWDSFYTPEFVLEEVYKHREEIIAKTKRSEIEFEKIFELMRGIIQIIPKEEYADRLEMAERISPDPSDAPYFALALKLSIPIWSNDGDLKKQKGIRIFNTEEILKQ